MSTPSPMTRLAELSSKILRRALELVLTNPGMTMAEAQRRSARQIASVEKIKAAALPPKQLADDGHGAVRGAKEELFSRIFGMRQRNAQSGGHSGPLQSPPVQSGAPGQPLASSGATDAPKRGLLKRYRLRRDDEPSQPTPARSMQEVGLLMGILLGGGSRTQLINGEFDNYPRYADSEALRNWRASIEANERRRNQPPTYDDDLDVTNLHAVMDAYDKQKRERGQS